MMHLAAELDSKAGDCQVGFSFEGREKERERERASVSQSEGACAQNSI